VIGGGFAGLEVIRRLARRFEVVLADVKNFFEVADKVSILYLKVHTLNSRMYLLSKKV
jgi:NADH dehydrogenase FAD-containing subunit